MEQLKISELYSDLSKTLAKELLEGKTYPWEVLVRQENSIEL